MRASTDLTLLKLGGSAITRKSTDGAVRLRTISQAAEAISRSSPDLIVVYGGGKRAHAHAVKYRLGEWPSTRTQLLGLTHVKLILENLGAIIGRELEKSQVPNVHICPSSILQTENGRIKWIGLSSIKHARQRGLLPILHGDIVTDVQRGFSILSGDTLTCELATRMKARKVLFGCDVDGIYSHKGNGFKGLQKEIGSNSLQSWIQKVRGRKDATGGMARKLLEAKKPLAHGIRVKIFNLTRKGYLHNLLSERHVRCTELTP